MIIQKSLETKLDLTDPSDILDPGIKAVCFKHLKERYVGKCYMSCLILKINKILRHSCRYMSSDLSGSAWVTVNFEVDGIIYNRGEIITGCHIAKIESDGRIHATSKFAGIQIRQDSSLMNIYKEGQVVPFIAKRVKYNPAQSAISVEALPFTPIFPKPVVYEIGKPLGDYDKERIKYLFERLESMKKETQELDSSEKKKAYSFFQKLLYPFKKNKRFESKEFEKKKLTWENVQNVSGYITQPRESKFSDEEFFVSNSKPKYDTKKVDLVFALDLFLNRLIRHHEILLEFVKTYPTFAKVQEYKDIWRMFNMLKI